MFGNRSPRGSHHWSTFSIQLMSLWRPHIQNPSGGIAISNLVLLGLIYLLSSGSLEQQAWSTQSISRSSQQQSHWWDTHHPYFFLHNYSRFFINFFFLFMCRNLASYTQFASLLLSIRFYSVPGMAGMHLARMLMTRIIKAIRESNERLISVECFFIMIFIRRST